MRKKLLAMASLLCAATLCAGVGVATLGNEVNTVVSAEESTFTYTDKKGTEYTLIGNRTEDMTKWAYTVDDLGDLVDDRHKMILATEDGYVGSPVPVGANQNDSASPTMLSLNAQDWTTTTGSVSFQFKTSEEWYTPTYEENGATTAGKHTASRIYVYFGGTYFYMQPTGSGHLDFKIYDRNSTTLLAGNTAITRDAGSCRINYFFCEGGVETGALTYEMSDYATLRFERYEVKDQGAYLLKIGCSMPGKTGITTVYRGIVPYSINNSSYDDFAIKNCLMGYATNKAAVITESGYENFSCNLYVRRGDGVVNAKVGTETYKDVATLTDMNKGLAENFAMGFTPELAGTAGICYDYDINEFATSDSLHTGDALGIEFRAKLMSDASRVAACLEILSTNLSSLTCSQPKTGAFGSSHARTSSSSSIF